MDAVLHDHLTPLIGEFAWHTLVVDPRIAGESQRHFNLVKSTLNQYSAYQGEALHILELACYAHTTGYDLADDLGAQVTLFELSRHSLSKGRELSERKDVGENPRLVIGDFHQLPFEDDSFNYIFICSALHHTWRFEVVLEEMMRVLAPGGLIFLENEPTHRGFCFYKFRCNRPHEFTPFEHELEKLGIIRTIAEPYLGSRPESLFGMIENQNMPLGQILSTVGKSCDLLGLGLFPETVMGKLEHRWFQSRFAGATMLKKDISENLQERIQAAQKFLTPAEKGMGFSLPTPEEVNTMAESVAQALAGLQGNPNTLGFRMGLSEIFGAPLQLVARKRIAQENGNPQGLNDPIQAKETIQQLPKEHFIQKHQRFNQKHEQTQGIYNGFSPEVQEVLSQTSHIPEMVKDQLPQLQTIFKDQEWCLRQGDYDLIAMEDITHDLISITNLGNTAQIQLPRNEMQQNQFVLLLRIHCELDQQDYYQLQIQCGEQTLDEHSVFKTESILCRSVISQAMLLKSDYTIHLTMKPMQQSEEKNYRIAIAYAGMFALNEQGLIQEASSANPIQESVQAS